MTTTPSQTVGPFFGFGLPYDGGPDLVPEDHPGAITLRGRVLDGAEEPVPDALVEIWQAGADGAMSPAGALRRGPDFSGFGRCPTDSTGAYRFRTVRPGGDGAHIAMLVFARGLLKPVLTRVYFHEADVDPAVPADRRATLVATGDHFDIRLQGEGETVFFAY